MIRPSIMQSTSHQLKPDSPRSFATSFRIGHGDTVMEIRNSGRPLTESDT